MTDNTKIALLAGATGLVGQCVLDILLQDTAYSKVVVLTRRPLQYRGSTEKLEEVIVDFDQLHKFKEAIRADDIFCCLGTTIKKAGSQAAFRQVDQVYPVRLAEIALENGASQFLIITALGSDPKSLIFYNRVKGEVEETLEQMPYKSVHIIQPSLLLGKRADSRMGEGIAQAVVPLLNPFLLGPAKKYRPIKGEQVARAMVALAKKNMKGFHRHPNLELFRY